MYTGCNLPQVISKFVKSYYNIEVENLFNGEQIEKLDLIQKFYSTLEGNVINSFALSGFVAFVTRDISLLALSSSGYKFLSTSPWDLPFLRWDPLEPIWEPTGR